MARAGGVVLCAAGLALIAAGCGSASSTTRAHSSRTATTPRSNASVIPTGSVAVVNGSPITQATLDHWIDVAAKSEAEQSPGTPTIAPTDPPAFKDCIAQVRRQVPSLKRTPAKTLKADCAQLYRSLSSQALDFLIKSEWIQADAARLGVTPTQAQVLSTYNSQRNKQFPNGAGYQAFLTKTGQTAQDVVYRFRIDVTVTHLTAREKGSATARQNAVTQREKRLYLAQTHCAPLVVMADCAGYHSG